MRVLVVEDEPRLAETIRRGLLAEGVLADVTPDGVEAVRMASGGEHDVVLLDIMLPGLNGYRVLERMRGADVWIPVLVLTAKDGEYDQVDAFDLGADDYLTKPFSFAVLLARLRALVRRGAPERPAVLAAGDLTLDPARRIVRRAGHGLDLTPREFGLLEYLLRHRGDVVSKAEILRDVWDPHYDGDDNVVEVYVGYLRRKTEAEDETRLIHTVRGVGYVLKES